jgi:thioredoxin 1
MRMQAPRLTDQTFAAEVLEQDGLRLVDFWSFWCAACQHRSGIIDRLAVEYGDVVGVGRIDVDDHRRIAAAFGVVAAPALLLFRRGQVIERLDGAVSGAQIRGMLERYLASEGTPRRAAGV